jgi:predicted transposase/invertase (TIGR01784 family)
VLDVRARDQLGRVINIEMQLLLPRYFKGRILYYWSGMFRAQLRDDDNYELLRPTISICLVNQALFPEVDDYHLAFELLDPRHNACFTDLMQVHVLQLPKLVRKLEELGDDLQIWLYFFRNAASLDPAKLPAPLDQPIYRRAMKELEILTKDERDRIRYESRMMAIRDQMSLEKDVLAAREEAKSARAEGRAEGREEGLAKGECIGRIHAYEHLLNRPLTPSDDLVQLAINELVLRADRLQSEIQSS